MSNTNNKSMDFKIVYVFGPATSEEKYFNDETLTLQNG